MSDSRFQILVATMNRDDLSLTEKMNIHTDALIINQTALTTELMQDEKHNIKMLSYNERGLSKSRNKAIANSNADICLIADDDVVYYDGFKEKILEAYNNYPEYDIITFAVPATNQERVKKYYTVKKKMGYIRAMKIASFEISFKRRSIVENNIKFREKFGAGSSYPAVGEDSIFIFDCLKKGLKILFLPVELGIVTHADSTWFNGFDKEYFYQKGIAFAAMVGPFAPLYALQFIFRKINLYIRNINPIYALIYIFRGIKGYKNIHKN